MRASFRPGLERDTDLLPWLIAESVCQEVSRFLEVELPARYAVWLEAKAEICYAGHRRFRKLMRDRGNAPREWLCAFMRHWLGSILQLERPDLCRLLPPGFAYGETLPRETLRAAGTGGRLRPYPPPARAWDPARVTWHRRWAWLARIAKAEGRHPGQGADALVQELYHLCETEIKIVERKKGSTSCG
jgi:hypothetical protein